jgi:hypothetical protein
MQRWEVPDRDLLFIKFSRGFESHKRILAFISKTKEIDNSGGFDVRLDTAGVINNTGEMLPFNDRISYMTKNEVISVPTMVGTPSSGVLHKRLLRYRARTRNGDCGAPLSLLNSDPLQSRALVGLHVGHQYETGFSFATPLDYEICVEAIERLKSDHVEEATFEESRVPEGIVVQGIESIPFKDNGQMGSFDPVAEVNMGLSLPVRSNLQETVFGRSRALDEEISLIRGEEVTETLVPMKLGPYKEEGVVVYPMEEHLRLLVALFSSPHP